MRPRPTLLVIEDDAIAKRLIEAVAVRAGFNAAAVSTGAAAAVAADSIPIDIIIVDLQLPDAGGFELIERLRARVQLAGVPFLVCTGNVTMENIIEARRLGALEFIRKPIDLYVLQRRLENSLDALTDRWIPGARAGLHTSQEYHQQADALRHTREGMAAAVALLDGDAPTDEMIDGALKELRPMVQQTESSRLLRLLDDMVTEPPSAQRPLTLLTALRVALVSLDQLIAG